MPQNGMKNVYYLLFSTCIPDSTNIAYIIRTTKDIRWWYLMAFAFNNCWTVGEVNILCDLY